LILARHLGTPVLGASRLTRSAEIPNFAEKGG
jgi:hypothetical protein